MSQVTKGDLNLVVSTTRLRPLYSKAYLSSITEMVCVVKRVKSSVPLVTRAKAFDYKHTDFDGYGEPYIYYHGQF